MRVQLDLYSALIGSDTNLREGLWTWGLICQRNFNTFEASKHPIHKKMSDLYTFLKLHPTYSVVSFKTKHHFFTFALAAIGASLVFSITKKLHRVQKL